MSMIPEVKCRRCGETFSSMRSRCPNCGTRRVTQSGRTPGTTPGTVRGTASYERAETNTKWQMIFGLILVVTVILAVIVMVSTGLNGSDNPGGDMLTPPAAVTYTPLIEAPPTDPPTPTPTVESIRIMYFNEERTEFQMRVGEEPIPLTAQVLPATVTGVKVNWSIQGDDTGEYCTVESTGDTSCEVSIHKAKAGGVVLVAECNGVTQTCNVWLAEAATN